MLAKENHDISDLHKELHRVNIFYNNLVGVTEERKSIYGKLTVIAGGRPKKIGDPLSYHTSKLLHRAKDILSRYDTDN
jgi:hypothetical protein